MAAELPDYPILGRAIYEMDGAQIKALQGERLAAMAYYVYAHAPFWRRKFDKLGLEPGDIKGVDDLSKIPFCGKKELQADQEENPPMGSYVCTPPARWHRFLTTTGTTGVPLRRVFSKRDYAFAMQRFQTPDSVTPGDVYMLLGPTDGLVGPTTTFDGVTEKGGLLIPAGRLDTRAKIKLIQDMRPVTISGTASYLLRVLEVADEMGVDMSKQGIKRLGSVGEPGVAVSETKKRLQEGFGVSEINDGYGMTELFPLGGACAGSPDLHIGSDIATTEVIDPDTGEPLPAGEMGEAVFSNLVGDTQPLLRYRSGDLCRLATDEKCPACGFAGPRLAGSVHGRADETIFYRGVKVFPMAIEGAVRSIDELNHEYQVVVDGKGALPNLTVLAETLDGTGGGDGTDGGEALEKRLAQALKSAIRVNAKIQLLSPGSLPRDDGGGKVRRVVDKRKA